MNAATEWVLRGLLTVRTVLGSAADRVTPARGGRDDAGQTSFEYLGIAVVIAVIIGVLSTTDIGHQLLSAIEKHITKISGP
jgi:uncharacterized membrane protein